MASYSRPGPYGSQSSSVVPRGTRDLSKHSNIMKYEVIRKVFIRYRGKDVPLQSVLKVGRAVHSDIVIEHINSKHCEIRLDPKTHEIKLFVYTKLHAINLVRAEVITESSQNEVNKLPVAEVGKFLRVDKNSVKSYVEATLSVGDVLYFKDSLLKPHVIEIKATEYEIQRSRAEWMQITAAVHIQMEKNSAKIDELNIKIAKLRSDEAKRRRGDPELQDDLIKKIKKMQERILKDKDEFANQEREEKMVSRGKLAEMNKVQLNYQEQHEAIQKQIRDITWSSDQSLIPRKHPNEAMLPAECGRGLLPEDPLAGVEATQQQEIEGHNKEGITAG